MDIIIEENKFKDWLKQTHPNPTTQFNYIEAEKRFLKRSGLAQAAALSQVHINIWLDFANRKSNPLNFAFIKNYLECYDSTRTSGLSVVKSRSKKYKPAPKNKFLEKEEIDVLIEKLPTPLNLIIRVMFETGLRRQELLDIKYKDLNFNEREIKGVGKNNKEFRVHFSIETGKLLIAYCIGLYGNDFRSEEKIFVFNRRFSAKKPYTNQGWAFWYALRRECEKLGFEKMFVHKIRFSLGRYLRRDKKFDLEQVRVKLRHENLNTTQRYSEATIEEINRKEDAEVF